MAHIVHKKNVIYSDSKHATLKTVKINIILVFSTILVMLISLLLSYYLHNNVI